ncbi:MAG: hypothetical protein COV29_03850 [Candidatus Yanofskybacteria bacterium CG10_big_fil_rev_8_21_14_0_10_36_16]|uniref:Uncharacterized protein n=1 Tax=Candidatus Yanofskybacteria bacterium CG10_big_fil_rev_8_21_14_0_10_36_16 TaxID=1975096 RepID=A0A2J0Q6X8_9BACT|nr:MAG: hypothetical protein COV29_03850 [Candidatus Yanofskybacteria bacterium CG10_big_fil_rev_8_21_14_0_10_36_16]
MLGGYNKGLALKTETLKKEGYIK